jgi:hypothetical protein
LFIYIARGGIKVSSIGVWGLLRDLLMENVEGDMHMGKEKRNGANVQTKSRL